MFSQLDWGKEKISFFSKKIQKTKTAEGKNNFPDNYMAAGNDILTTIFLIKKHTVFVFHCNFNSLNTETPITMKRSIMNCA